jgi:hypothetical protein
MSENPDAPSPGQKGAAKAPGRRDAPPEATREDRLKAALKANMGRRKAQARARSGTGNTDTKNE